MRISELVKTYRFLNDPDAPAWNVKFVGAIGILGLVALAVGGLYWVTAQDGTGATAPAAIGAEGAQAPADDDAAAVPLVDYVGFPPGAASVDPAVVEATLASWKAAHPGVRILSQEPSYSATGEVAGYTLRYLP